MENLDKLSGLRCGNTTNEKLTNETNEIVCLMQHIKLFHCMTPTNSTEA